MPTGSRSVKIKLETSAAGVDAGLREASRKLRAFQRDQERATKKAKRDEEKAAKDRKKQLRETGDRGAGLVHGVAVGIGAAAGFDIASVMSDSVKSVFDAEKELTRFGIDANLSAQQLAGFRDQVMTTSNATGVARLELIKAAHAYQILTGDANGAMQVTSTFADVANASGASMEDIATAAASMKQNMHLDPANFRQAFDVMLNLGHKGALELRDFAGELSGLAPQFNSFGSGSAIDKLTEMGAAMETVKLNFKDSAETATGFRAAMVALSKSKVAAGLENLGVKVWTIDPKTKQHVKRDFFDIITDIKKKVPDMKVLQDVLGGRQESSRAIQALLEHYDELVKLRAEAANSDQVSVDSHKYMESSAGRMQVAWTKIQNSIASALTPERIEAFAAVLEKAAEFAGNIAMMLNRFLNGPDAKEEEGRTVQQLVKSANSNPDNPQVEKSTIENAKDILNSDEFAKNWVESEVGGAGVGGATPETIAAARKAAAEFLKSEGIKDPWDVAGGKGGKMDPQALAQLGKSIGLEIASQLAKVGIVVKADQNAIAHAGKNAPLNRGAKR